MSEDIIMKIIVLNRTARMNRQCIPISIEHKRSFSLLEHLQLITTIHLLLLILSLLSNSSLFDLSFFFNCCSLYHLQRQYICYADWFTRDLQWLYKSKQRCNDWRRCWERINMLNLRFHCYQNFDQRSWRFSKWRRLIIFTDYFWSAYYMISSQLMMNVWFIDSAVLFLIVTVFFANLTHLKNFHLFYNVCMKLIMLIDFLLQLCCLSEWYLCRWKLSYERWRCDISFIMIEDEF